MSQIKCPNCKLPADRCLTAAHLLQQEREFLTVLVDEETGQTEEHYDITNYTCQWQEEEDCSEGEIAAELIRGFDRDSFPNGGGLVRQQPSPKRRRIEEEAAGTSGLVGVPSGQLGGTFIDLGSNKENDLLFTNPFLRCLETGSELSDDGSQGDENSDSESGEGFLTIPTLRKVLRFGSEVEDVVVCGRNGFDKELFRVSCWNLGKRVFHHVFTTNVLNSPSLHASWPKLENLGIGNRASLVITRHSNHVHVVHGCHFNNSVCKCLNPLTSTRVFNEPGFKPSWKLLNSFWVPAYRFTELRRKQLWKHLVEGDGYRRLLFAQLSHSGGCVYSRDFDEAPGRAGRETSKELCNQVCDFFRGIGKSDGADGFEDSGPEDESNKDSNKNKPLSSLQAIAAHFVTDVMLRHWTTHETFLLTDAEFNEVYGKRVTWKQDDFRKMWKLEFAKAVLSWNSIFKVDHIRRLVGDNHPSFGLESGELCGVDESVNFLLRWFYITFGGGWKDELEHWRKWFDRETGKLNSIYIVGEKDTYKSTVHNSIALLKLAVGRIGRYVQRDQFIFANITSCCVILHEEAEFPRLDPGYTETMKQIMEGSTASVNVKFRDHQQTSKAPLIGSANKIPWHDCVDSADKEAFKARTHLIFTRPGCEYNELKGTLTTRNLNPLAWLVLFKEKQMK